MLTWDSELNAVQRKRIFMLRAAFWITISPETGDAETEDERRSKKAGGVTRKLQERRNI